VRNQEIEEGKMILKWFVPGKWGPFAPERVRDGRSEGAIERARPPVGLGFNNVFRAFPCFFSLFELVLDSQHGTGCIVHHTHILLIIL
jgi:hypothetical protein